MLTGRIHPVPGHCFAFLRLLASSSESVRNELHSRDKLVFDGIRYVDKALYQSTRESHPNAQVAGLQFQSSSTIESPSYVPLRNVSVVAYIKMIDADLTATTPIVEHEQCLDDALGG